MERIIQLLPSILIIAGVALGTFLYLKLMAKRFVDRLKSVEWVRENKWKVYFSLSCPWAYIFAPAAEELLFRAPLIIAFNAFSSTAWYSIAGSSILFSIGHYFGKMVFAPEHIDALFKKENKKSNSDSVKQLLDEVEKEKGDREIRIRRVVRVIGALAMGFLLGYCAIKYQSLWIVVGIHSGCNLILPVVLQTLIILLLLLGIIVWDNVSRLWEELRWQFRRRILRWR